MDERGQSMTVVPMEPKHIEDLERLELECFSTPWSFDSLVSELSNPLAVFRVAEVNGQVGKRHDLHLAGGARIQLQCSGSV